MGLSGSEAVDWSDEPVAAAGFLLCVGAGVAFATGAGVGGATRGVGVFGKDFETAGNLRVTPADS